MKYYCKYCGTVLTPVSNEVYDQLTGKKTIYDTRFFVCSGCHSHFTAIYSLFSRKIRKLVETSHYRFL